MFQKLDTVINSFILAQVSKKNTGRSISLLVLNSIIDGEESVSFLRHRQSSQIPIINSLLRTNLGFVFAAIILILWKFVTLFLRGKKSYFFFDGTGGVRLRKKEKKEKKDC